jgi:hypothetical protein
MAMSPTRLVLRRRARARERGAIVFIVAMTLSVLATLGLYALLTSSSEVKTAGNARQNLQSHYLSEAGIIGVALQLAPPGAGDSYINNMQPNTGHTAYDSTKPRNQCWSLSGVPSTDTKSQACQVMLYRSGTATVQRFDINQTFSGSYNTATLFNSTLYPTTLNPEIRVEITDPMITAPIGGFTVDGSATARACAVTVTTYGETLPSSGSFGGVGLEVGRARVSFTSNNSNCR